MQYDLLFTFISVHDAVRAEHLLAGAGLETIARPTPREIDLSCGQSLLLKGADQAAALEVLAANAARWSLLYRRLSDRVWEKIREYGE
ncbi:DUF3343 domain-containing protein [Anaeroselena agilis]|uniref:DUF3343 domain-containing protein n=1 Tax=Anaeroselena agilis TaxID=3063788 RepID=A0ABU3P5B7_9FIRM|nr:DUF3343 domain-containing protein [Selenomonadales bacterium 4137-cl]